MAVGARTGLRRGARGSLLSIPKAPEEKRSLENFGSEDLEGIRTLADFYISLYISIHDYICLCVFAYFLHAFVHIS